MSHLSSHHYRALAEGLLNKALELDVERGADHIREAIRHLRYARAQEHHQEPDDSSDGLSPEAQQDAQHRYRLVRQLLKQALEAPTPKGLEDLLQFATKFRRLSVWNANMAYIQRPGARVIASEFEWKREGRFVQPDAAPIIILWPRSPIRFVYEFEDTGPLIDRKKINDPFAVDGQLPPKALDRLIKSLKKQKTFKISLEGRRQGFSYAGSAAAHGSLPIGAAQNGLMEGGSRIGQFAQDNAETGPRPRNASVPAYRITFNERLNTAERFATIAHELGHIFCGHLGACASGPRESDESGWRDRRSFSKHEKEVEAEAVAFVVASRAGVVPASAEYLREFVRSADISRIDPELIVRAAARIERLAGLHYGTMAFEPGDTKG
jgi:hypothetical protein